MPAQGQPSVNQPEKLFEQGNCEPRFEVQLWGGNGRQFSFFPTKCEWVSGTESEPHKMLLEDPRHGCVMIYPGEHSIVVLEPPGPPK